MYLETQPFYVKDFKGGITDFYLDADPSRYNLADNLIIDAVGQTGKLVTRAGCELWDTVHPQIPDGIQRVGHIWRYRNSVFNGSTLVPFDYLMFQTKNKINYVDSSINYSAGNWVTVEGKSVFEYVQAISLASPTVIDFPKHGLAENDQIKFGVTSGSLPPEIVAGTTYYVRDPLTNSFNISASSGGAKINTSAAGSGLLYFYRVAANNVYKPATTVSSVVSKTEWKEFIFTTSDDGVTRPQKIYPPGYTQKIVTQNAGLPKVFFRTYSPAGVGALNYIYAIFLEVTYTTRDGSVTYIDVGPPTFQQVYTQVDPPDVTNQLFTTYSVPFRANGDNYPQAKVRFARTINNGTTFYVLNPSADAFPGGNFTDNLSDATIQTLPLMYTQDGTVEFEEFPSSRFIHIVNDTAYCGYTSEYSDTGALIPYGSLKSFPTKLMQSIPGVPGSTNGSFFTELKEEIKGISSHRGIPLVFCDNIIYRIEGQFDELGRGGMFPQVISNEASCVSHNSIVQTNDGVYWWGKNAIYYTDGYRVTQVNTGWPNTYLELVNSQTKQNRIQGKLDAFNRRIYWTVQTGGGSDCNKVYVLDLNYGISDDMPFTALVNHSNQLDFASALEFIDDNWYRGDSQGYLFKHDPEIFSDLKVDTAVAPTSWIRNPIVYRYVSAAVNFGMSFTRYWVTRIITQFKNVTNLSLQILSNNDDSRILTDLKPIRFRGNILWGDDSVIWGDPSIPWNLTGFIEAQRRFPAKSLRCSFKQVEFTNAFVRIVNSDFYGNITLDTVLKTATLINYPSVSWPTESTNYVIAFQNDNYTREFIITARTASVLTFYDPINEAPASGTWEWVVRGIPINEVMSLQSYTIHYAPLGKTQNTYNAVESGENADA